MKKMMFLAFAVFCAFAFVSCNFETADHVGDNNDPEQGEVGGECYPNSTCNSDYVCVKGVCEYPVANDNAVTDNDTATVPDDASNLPALSQSECAGMEMYLSEPADYVVFFGALGAADVKSTKTNLGMKVIVAEDYVKYACAAIAYRANDTIITPLECVGIQGNEACHAATCLGGVTGRDPVCIWSCDPNHCTK